jgi:hypothetical protein
MGSLPWIGLIVFAVAFVAGVVFAVLRVIAFVHTYKSFKRRLDVTVAATRRSFDGIEPRVAKTSASAARLEEARARLEESVATAKVLFDAFGEALALMRRISAFVPR